MLSQVSSSAIFAPRPSRVEAQRRGAVPRLLNLHHGDGLLFVALELPGVGSVQLTVGTNAAGRNLAEPTGREMGR